MSSISSINEENVANIIKQYTYNDTTKDNFDTSVYSIIKNKTRTGSSAPNMLDVNEYFNMEGVMSPYIYVQFKDKYVSNSGTTGTYDFGTSIDTTKNDYIVSVNIEDTGIKKITLVLYDRSFTYIAGLLERSVSASQIIQNNVISSSIDIATYSTDSDATISKTINSGTIEVKEDPSEEEAINYNLEMVKMGAQNAMDNLIVRIGYACDNPTQARITEYLNKINSSKSTARWTEASWDITKKTTENEDISQQALLSNVNQSCVKSQKLECLITNIQSNISETGIKYTVTAISSDFVNINNLKLVEKYACIKGTAREVLATLMNKFNVDGSPLRVFWYDNIDIINGDEPTINTEKDSVSYSEEDDPDVSAAYAEYNNAKTVYNNSKTTANKNKMDTAYSNLQSAKNKYAASDNDDKKIISISLGGEEAKENILSVDKNYISEKNKIMKVNFDNVHYYKSIASIFNDFASQCPPYKDNTENAKNNETFTQDENGNTQKITTDSYSMSRRLTWKIIGYYNPGKENLPIIGFYYNKPYKFANVRKYTWGPGSGIVSCVKNVDISNSTEFALMSSAYIYDRKNKSTISCCSRTGWTTAKTENTTIKSPMCVNEVISGSSNAQLLQNAYQNSLYKGSITILGDPGLMFAYSVQPYTLPIFLDIKLPYEDTWNNKGTYYQYWASGYYVISKITHSISTSGFSTVLDVLSYPNIQNDI